MHKNILFFTIFCALCSNIQAMQKPQLPKEYNYVPLVFFHGIDPKQEAAFEKYARECEQYERDRLEIANPLPAPSTQYIPFMGSIYSMTIIDPQTRKSYVYPDAYFLYCARQDAANNPAERKAYYQALQQKLDTLRQQSGPK